MRSLITVFISFVFGLCACKKEQLKDDKSILTGRWKWVYTQHAFGWCDYNINYESIFASASSKQYSVEFIAKGRVSFYEDGNIVETNRVVFAYFDSDNQGGYYFYIYLDNKKEKSIEGGISGDTLTIKYPYVEPNPDCENYLNFFVRE